ncbi:hypothetical protein BDV25DRAFT_137294 [Aspergillus avenaceus]|uniref:EF-hand domain-containing protein n=1 Tax=Aspergillus avenaceus TaxID=36643 RepID=A0A5N6U340_ASPAV|nr:hypothetical protein BDV25DRAFT_137294 [Aspergillus avenaceus]
MCDSPETLKLRKNYRDALRTIKDKIINLGTNQIEPCDVQNAGICQQSLSLEDDRKRPYFFVPFEKEYIPTDEIEYHIYDESNENHINWGDMNFGDLFDLDYNWTVSFTCPAPVDTGLPHMKCIMDTTDINGDDRLTQGELISIINIMVGRLKTKSLRPHVVAPVMVYSVMGPAHLRVLEAYYNGQHLVVRKTELYDMRDFNPALITLLTKWWLGYAVGETKTLTPPAP